MILWDKRVEHGKLGSIGTGVAGREHDSKLVEEDRTGSDKSPPRHGEKVEYLRRRSQENMTTLWSRYPHQVSRFPVPYKQRPHCVVIVGKIRHDSGARDGKRSAYYRGRTLRDGPRNGVGGGRAVRRTVPKVEKVDAKQAAYNQPLSVTHSRRGRCSPLSTFTGSEQIFMTIYGKIKHLESGWRDAPHVDRLSARGRWDV